MYKVLKNQDTLNSKNWAHDCISAYMVHVRRLTMESITDPRSRDVSIFLKDTRLHLLERMIRANICAANFRLCMCRADYYREIGSLAHKVPYNVQCYS